MGIDKQYYHDKEDAFLMKYFFDKQDYENEKGKIIDMNDDIKWDDIMHSLEEVDNNGEELNDENDLNVDGNKDSGNNKEVKEKETSNEINKESGKENEKDKEEESLNTKSKTKKKKKK